MPFVSILIRLNLHHPLLYSPPHNSLICGCHPPCGSFDGSSASWVKRALRATRLTLRVTISYAGLMETLLSVRVLKLFGQLGKNSLDLHTLFEAAGNDTEERQHVLDAVEELIQAGMLEAKGGDFFALTEKAKEEIAKS